MDTIFALATVPGKAGVAVVRVSGPAAFESCRAFGFQPFEARKTGLRRLLHHTLGFVDEALVILFDEGASFTGEPVVEFHLHGSIAIIHAVLGCLGDIPEFRAADPGEFTRRALDNRRLDLTQVEALSDLIDAETEVQRKQALSGFSGRLRDEAEHWRSDLIHALALLEATIDFADEDVPVDVSDDVSHLLTGVLRELRKEIDGFGIAERVRTGFEVAIVGPPNAGKSTLLNTLAGRDAAITSEIAGTTRDVIEVRMDLGGLPVTFLDTAGLRDTNDVVEAIGVKRAVDRANAADLRIFLTQGSLVAGVEVEDNDLVLSAKSDLTGEKNGVSGLTGEGVPELIDAVRSVLLHRSAGAGLISHARQMNIVIDGHRCIAAGKDFVDNGTGSYELASEELRSGIFSLERLVGRVDVEDVLDKVFSSFCIGK